MYGANCCSAPSAQNLLISNKIQKILPSTETSSINYWCSLFFVSRQLFTHWKKKITSHCLRQSQGKLLNEEGCVLVVLALHFVSDRRRPTVIVREVLWWHPAPTKTSPNTIWKVLMDQGRIWLCWETERKS